MRVSLTEAFQRSARELAADERASTFQVILDLPGAIGKPHTHVGLGIRKLHSSGIWEARFGLGLRIVFTLDKGEITLVRLGTHDEVRRYLRTL